MMAWYCMIQYGHGVSGLQYATGRIKAIRYRAVVAALIILPDHDRGGKKLNAMIVTPARVCCAVALILILSITTAVLL